MSTDAFFSLVDYTTTAGVAAYLFILRRKLVAKVTDPKKKRRVSQALHIGMPVVIVCTIIRAAIHFSTLESPSERIARQFNTAAQTMIDPVTRLDGARAEPPNRVIIDDTIITLTAAQIPKSAWDACLPKLIKQIENPQIKQLEKAGVTFVFRYHGSDGALVGEVVVPQPFVVKERVPRQSLELKPIVFH